MYEHESKLTELDKQALTIDALLMRGAREECKEYGFGSYDDKTNDAIYLLALDEVLKIEDEYFPTVRVIRHENRFEFISGDIGDDTFGIWGSNTKFEPYSKKETLFDFIGVSQ